MYRILWLIAHIWCIIVVLLPDSNHIDRDIYIELFLTVVSPFMETTSFQHAGCIPMPMSWVNVSHNIRVEKAWAASLGFQISQARPKPWSSCEDGPAWLGPWLEARPCTSLLMICFTPSFGGQGCAIVLLLFGYPCSCLPFFPIWQKGGFQSNKLNSLVLPKTLSGFICFHLL